jgi:hypothetical protein
MTTVDQIANAVLYEGYLLYPYRPSSVKNRQRWNFGLVYPPNYAGVLDGSAFCAMQTECLVRGNDLSALTTRIRCLQVATRQAAWQEAVEREISLPALRLSDVASQPFTRPFQFESDPDCTRLLQGAVDVCVKEASRNVYQVTVRIANLTELAKEDQGHHDTAVPQAMVSTHTILEVTDGDFVSLLEPPEDLREAGAACRNLGTWPVLAGEKEQFKCMLSSPIILYDYPEVAPESPGDLFDGTEIDEILTLRILTMTDQEKEEMRHADERARGILERTESLPQEHLAKLHGAMRDLHPELDR